VVAAAIAGLGHGAIRASTPIVTLSPAGNDGNRCTRAAPCLTFRRALAVARSGSTVELVPGSYPSQTLTGGHAGVVTFQPEDGGRVTLSGRLTLEGVRNVRLVDFDFPRSDPLYELLLDACNSNVTLVDSTGRRFVILEGNARIRFLGGAWGGYGRPGDEDSAIGTSGSTGPSRTCGGRLASPSHDLLFDGVTFHDNFWRVPESKWGGSHPDCFEINGYAYRITIRDSTFIRCQDSFLGLYPDQGGVTDVTIDHNRFVDLGDTTYYGSQWVSEDTGHRCGGIVFTNNLWRPNNPRARYAYSSLRTMCEPPAGVPPARVIGNDFQKGPVREDCARFTAPPYRTVWRHNTFRLGSPCTGG
jgi:hypothetical protein